MEKNMTHYQPGQNKQYTWDEATTSWVEVEQGA